ncbi:hypothetical protein [Pedobacter cryophilus]|uniref:Uncharacterized protein n=1 Tax=Pedobacter cryophilus TaxID=2571271 RepID=A0A4U1C493_9SPHI|nr:hypothetical protein [Pedobacter cryophilus]TKB98959.1 hypothetical protein FA046_07540 [Pedobacter cryophilus]
MAQVDQIRNQLINKILSIRNTEFLIALDHLISSGEMKKEVIEFTKEQELMIKMSEEDIINGRTTNHNQFMENTTEWLKQKKG